MPQNQTLDNKAGSFISRYVITGNTLQISRHIVIKKNVYAGNDYPDFEAMAYTAINDSRAVIGLKRKSL